MQRRTNKCFACGKSTGRNPAKAVTSDGQIVLVGSECYKQIGVDGYQPSLGGPRIFRANFAPDGIPKLLGTV